MTFEEFLKQIKNSKLVFISTDKSINYLWRKYHIFKIIIHKNIVRDEKGNIIGVVTNIKL